MNRCLCLESFFYYGVIIVAWQNSVVLAFAKRDGDHADEILFFCSIVCDGVCQIFYFSVLYLYILHLVRR